MQMWHARANRTRSPCCDLGVSEECAPRSQPRRGNTSHIATVATVVEFGGCLVWPGPWHFGTPRLGEFATHHTALGHPPVVLGWVGRSLLLPSARRRAAAKIAMATATATATARTSWCGSKAVRPSTQHAPPGRGPGWLAGAAPPRQDRQTRRPMMIAAAARRTAPQALRRLKNRDAARRMRQRRVDTIRTLTDQVGCWAPWGSLHCRCSVHARGRCLPHQHPVNSQHALRHRPILARPPGGSAASREGEAAAGGGCPEGRRQQQQQQGRCSRRRAAASPQVQAGGGCSRSCGVCGGSDSDRWVRSMASAAPPPPSGQRLRQVGAQHGISCTPPPPLALPLPLWPDAPGTPPGA